MSKDLTGTIARARALLNEAGPETDVVMCVVSDGVDIQFSLGAHDMLSVVETLANVVAECMKKADISERAETLAQLFGLVNEILNNEEEENKNG